VCGTLFLTLRVEHRVLENSVLRRIFGPKRDEMAGDWRRLQNDELHSLFLPPDIVRVMKSRWRRWAGHAACMGEMRNEYKEGITWKTHA